MFKVTTLITFKDDASEADRKALSDKLNAAKDPNAKIVYAGKGLLNHANGGDLVWSLLFGNQAHWKASPLRAEWDAIENNPIVKQMDACAYEIQRHNVSEPNMKDGIYRALFLHVKQGAPADKIKQFGNETVQMPDYIPEIRNWALNEAVETRGELKWTHIWEQEYRKLEDLRGPYMTSPHHWGVIDRWFDLEHPDWIVASRLCHSASEMPQSMMAKY
jgi:hypothetical protein